MELVGLDEDGMVDGLDDDDDDGSDDGFGDFDEDDVDSLNDGDQDDQQLLQHPDHHSLFADLNEINSGKRRKNRSRDDDFFFSLAAMRGRHLKRSKHGRREKRSSPVHAGSPLSHSRTISSLQPRIHRMPSPKTTYQP